LDELTKRVARLVRSYVEHVFPHLERQGGTPDEPMQAAKGSSNPPVSDWTLRLIHSNRVASGYLHWALEITEQGGVRSSEGIHYSEILRALRYDAGLLQTWRDKQPQMVRAFNEMCLHVAKGVMLVHGQTQNEKKNLERRMDLDPQDSEALVVKRAPDDEEETRGRTRLGQKIDTMHTRRLMVEQLEQIERAYPHYTTKECMEMLSDRKQRDGKDWSVTKLRRAVTEVGKEKAREEEVA
jgi:hypothetical protein